MPAPTHLDYPELGHESRLAEGQASNAAWDAIAAQLGVDVIHDTAVFDFPADLTKRSEKEYTVSCYVAEGKIPANRVIVLMRLESYGWSVVGISNEKEA